MTLRCGIVGLPNCGKSTVFNAITGTGAKVQSFAFSTTEPVVGRVAVPDDRLERIHAFVETKRVVPAELELVDIPGLAEGASHGEGLGNKFLSQIKEVDAILHVVRGFPDPSGAGEAVDPAGDIEVVETELALGDLATVERNLERVSKKARSGDKEARAQGACFTRIQDALGAGKQARALDLSASERALAWPMFLLTAKPVLFVANLPDSAIEDGVPHLPAALAGLDAEVFALAGKLEAELVEIDEADRALFLREMGLAERGLGRLVRAAYALLGLRTFFTAGEMEIKAWTFREGSRAPQAAGVIHSDFESKFIRAEVHSVADLEEHRNEAAIRAAGKLRVEGKDYAMRDGDVAHFLIGR